MIRRYNTKSGYILAKFTVILSAIVLFSVGSYIYLNQDKIKAKDFALSADFTKIVDSITLTERGRDILLATRPELQNKNEFNQNCNSHNHEVYVLGCYDEEKDRLFVYNVNSADLVGVREVTTAHELLHAAYHRLFFWEKSSINNSLKEIYDSLPKDSDLRTSMQSYREEDFYDELHSRIGTEIADIPTSLKQYFSKYFHNREKIINFNNQYHNVFKKLKTESEQLKRSIEEKKKDIDERKKTHQTNVQYLNELISQFNSRNIHGGFHSQSDFETQRRELIRKIQLLKFDYEQLKSDMESLNNDITRYNQNIYHSNELLDQINSNALPNVPTKLNTE